MYMRITELPGPMKSILSSITLLLFSIVFSQSLTAAPEDKVVLHLNTPSKMTMLVNNVKNLRAKLGKDADIVVVVNGPAVSRFTNLATSRNQLDELLELNTKVSICSFALKNRSLSKVHLLEGTSYLEDGGVASLVELQQAGYAYIKP